VFRLTLPRRHGVRLEASPLPLEPDDQALLSGPLPSPRGNGRPDPGQRGQRPPMVGVPGEAG
jgi:hypothetical protein